MDVISVSPLRVASLVWQSPRGGWVLTAVCKATYQFSPVGSALAEEQECPNEAENHWNDDPARSLYAPSDLAPFKPRAEVMLVGHAFAPRDEHRASFHVRLAVGSVDKSIEVFSDRAFSQGGALSQGPWVAKVPLRYERAAGGPETTNPVGVRLGATDQFGASQLPNLQPPGLHITRPGDFIEPIGLGPIAASWATRQSKLGRLQGQWSEGMLASLPMPVEVDPGYFMAAPADQQLDALRSNERLLLENLHPEHPRLVTSLPGIEPRAFLERPGSAPREIAMTCDTLWIDTDRGICALTWRSQIPLSSPQEPGRVVIAQGHLGQRLSWSEIEPLLHGQSPGAQAAPPVIEAPPSAAVAMPDRRKLRSTQEPPVQELPSAALPFARPASDSGVTPAPQVARPMYTAAPLRGTQVPAEIEDADNPFGGNTEAQGPAADASPYWLRASPPSAPLPSQSQLATPPPSAPRLPQPSQPQLSAPSPSAPFIPAPPPLVRPAPPAAPASSLSPWTSGAPEPPPAEPPRASPATPSVPPLPSAASPSARPLTMLSASAPTPSSPPALAPSAAWSAPPPSPAPAQSAGWSTPASSPAPAQSAGWSTPASSPAPAQSAGWSTPASPPTPAPSAGWSTPASSRASAPGAAARPAGNGEGGLRSAVAASNAAAASSNVETSSPAPSPTASRQTSPSPGASSREPIELIWRDPNAAPRVRAAEAFRDIFGSKSEPTAWTKGDDALRDTQEAKDRRDVLRALTRARVLDAAGLSQSLEAAFDADGVLAPPMILTAGELTFTFDEFETLKATITVVSPFIGPDKKLRDIVTSATELLKAEWRPPGDVAESFTTRVKEAFGQASRALAPNYLQSSVDKLLLEGRHYQRKTLLGENRIRALLDVPGGSSPVPAYLPDAQAKQVPLFKQFRAKVLAELHVRQDQQEPCQEALFLVALGRVVREPRAAS